MDGLTVFFIVFFGIAIIIPATWSIIGLIRGNTSFWPAVVGTAWAVVLLLVTFVGIGTKWGGCPVYGGTSEGAVTCVTGNVESPCKPDVLKLECQKRVIGPGCPTPSPSATPLPAGTFCPKGQKPVFPFCERIQFGRVKQPWATWSDLSFVAAGLWVLWFFQYFGRSGTTAFSTFFNSDNPMVKIGSLPIAYGLIVIFMGPPSQWFHASLKDWGGWFDTMSVVMWLMFNAVYVGYSLIWAMWDKGRGVARPNAVLITWGLLVIVFGLIAIEPKARLSLYFGAGVPWGVAEVFYVFFALKSSVKYRRTWWLFVINVMLLGFTMFLWGLWNDGLVSPTTCQMRENFPGHALFHILASFSTILTFFSFASERRVD
jgi:hypothetical protein